jgi:hypothetical protein
LTNSRVLSAAEQNKLNWRNDREDPEVGVQAGGRFGIHAARCFAIETGIDYNLHRYSGEIKSLTIGTPWDGIPYDSALAGARVRVMEKYHYFNIPLALNFILGKRKLKGIISMGANFNWLIKKAERVSWYVNQDMVQSHSTNQTSSFAQFNITPFIGLGVEWHIGKSLFLRLMPIAQMQAMKNINQPITEYLWSAGVNASVNFGFGKVK